MVLGNLAQGRRDRKAERAQIAALDPEALVKLRDQAAARLADMDDALRTRGIVGDDRAQRDAMRQRYGVDLRKIAPRKLPTRGKLTMRKRMFIEAFVSGPPGVRGIAMQAVRAAGLADDRSEGDRMMKDPAVRAELARLLARHNLRVEDVIGELRRIGMADLRDVAEWDGVHASPYPSDAITDDAAASVAEISVTSTPNGPQVKVKQHDKQAALLTLAKLFGIVDGGGTHVSVTVNNVETRLREMPPEERRRVIDRYVALTRDEDGTWRPATSANEEAK